MAKEETLEIVFQAKDGHWWRGPQTTAGIEIVAVNRASFQLWQTVVQTSLAQHGRHSAKDMIQAVSREAGQARMTTVSHAPRRRSIGRGGKQLHSSAVNVTDGVGPRSHGGVCGTDASSSHAGHAVFTSALGRRNTAGGLASIARARRRCGGLVKLLLVAKQQIATGKASCTFGAFEGLLLGVGALVPFQVLKTSKGALASCANVRTGFVRLWRGEVGRRFRAHGD